MQGSYSNPRYLPGIAFPPTLKFASGSLASLAAQLAQQHLLVVATTMAAA